MGGFFQFSVMWRSARASMNAWKGTPAGGATVLYGRCDDEPVSLGCRSTDITAYVSVAVRITSAACATDSVSVLMTRS